MQLQIPRPVRFGFWGLLGIGFAFSALSLFPLHSYAQRLDPITDFQLTANTPASRWVVQLTPGADVAVFAARFGSTAVTPIPGLDDFYVVHFPVSDSTLSQTAQAVALTLSAAPEVLQFQQDVPLENTTYHAVPNDPLYTNQWHLKNTGQFGSQIGLDANLEPAWALGYTGAGVHIGIVDDSLQYTHPDLDAPKYISTRSYDYAYYDPDPAPKTDGYDCWADDCHGTAVAGVAAGEAGNDVCGVGAAYDATISAQRLITNVSVTDSQIAAALLNSFAADTTPVDVSNNSWGPSTYYPIGIATRAALEKGATENNTIYVWSAGNSHQYPMNAGRSDYVNSRFTITVAALANDGRKAYYSEEGSAILVSAPSDGGSAGIYTTDLLGTDDGYGGLGDGGCTKNFGGTSAAAPLVSGIVALMRQANPDLTWRDVQHILVNAATPVDHRDRSWQTNGAGRLTSHKYGFGRLDAFKAVQSAEVWSMLPPLITYNSPVQSVNRPIPDGTGSVFAERITYGKPVSSSFTLSGLGIDALEHVEVVLNAKHQNGSNLRVLLTSPSGTTSELIDTSYTDGSPIDYDGGRTLMSVQFWGENPNGTWMLSVMDGAAKATGVWVDWSLNLYGTGDGTPQSEQLLANSGFEVAAGKAKRPHGWKKSGKMVDDEMVCKRNFANRGRCAFQFTGTPGEVSKLRQIVDVTNIQPGDTLTLSAHVRAHGAAPTHARLVRLIVTYAQDANNDGRLDRVKRVLRVPTAGTAYQFHEASLMVEAPVVRIKIEASYSAPDGSVLIDDLRLIRVSGGHAGLPLPPPAD